MVSIIATDSRGPVRRLIPQELCSFSFTVHVAICFSSYCSFSPLDSACRVCKAKHSLVKLKIRNKTVIQSQIDFVSTIPYNPGYQSPNREVFSEDWFLKIVIIIFQDFSHSFQYSYIILFVI